MAIVSWQSGELPSRRVTDIGGRRCKQATVGTGLPATDQRVAILSHLSVLILASYLFSFFSSRPLIESRRTILNESAHWLLCEMAGNIAVPWLCCRTQASCRVRSWQQERHQERHKLAIEEAACRWRDTAQP